MAGNRGKPEQQEPDLSRRALTVRLAVSAPMLPPEIDQPQILGLLLRSDRVNELNILWQLLERNTLSLKQTFVCCTAPHPGRKADRWRRLLPLAQYDSCLAQIQRHREERLQLTIKLQELLRQALIPETLPEAMELTAALRRDTAVSWQLTPAPTAEEFPAEELPGIGLAGRIPAWRRQRRRQALARYRQAAAEVQDHQRGPFRPESAWRQFSRVSYWDTVKFRAYLLMPGLLGAGPMRHAALRLRQPETDKD